MWKFITKNEFFKILHAYPEAKDHPYLKFIQDMWFRDFFVANPPGRVVEIGGGATRTLAPLAKRGVECWNADKFDGEAGGPTMDNISVTRQKALGIKIIPVYVGEFSDQLAADYFDVVFSISVMEHLTLDESVACFKDAYRILKPGGVAYHAVDFFLDTEPLDRTTVKIDILREAVKVAGLEPVSNEDIAPAPSFSPAFATAGDVYLARNWCFNPELQGLVENSQLVSLIMGHKKPLS